MLKLKNHYVQSCLLQIIADNCHDTDNEIRRFIFHTNRRYVIFFARVVLTRIFCRRMIRQELRPIAKKREKEKERGGVNIDKCVSVLQSKQVSYERYLIYPLLKICFILFSYFLPLFK